ncbi:Lrp/AsnC family transcriptional regulator [Haloquadratum walsbyi]|jgi:DNA-binding Lrp family transcriptional regulator|uniref:Lrp/AsnC family transcription regulator n=2 Tax=Haloquadratum walsbyi TaxID=293091 RepID=Q18FU1_HALWD|nr:Lrp/AsnC family transcriptional regulator [Haloquadratum walsbyi]CAJ53164.1 Lrp/AsnC family transcription regulator [Haloquadratum walsbyi DSM 16790]CCC41334.1 Lrp/AsnC family transcription regulator [Haloquadratum walsbyi C23]
MKDGELDSVDKQILYHLQRDARGVSSRDIGEELGLSPSTIRTRLNKLEASGIVRGYYIDIDYDLAGYPLYTKIICTAPVPKRDMLANRARDIHGVTAVREIMTGKRNIYVNAIGQSHDDLNRIAGEIDELGLDIVDEQLIRDEYVCPYHGFLEAEDVESADATTDVKSDDASEGR